MTNAASNRTDEQSSSATGDVHGSQIGSDEVDGPSDGDSADDVELGVSPNKPIDVVDGTELDTLLDRESLVLLELYTNNCGICQSLEPVLGHLHRETNLTVAMSNPQTDMSLIDRFQISSVPTLVLFHEGEQLASLAEGFQGAEAIIQFVDSNLPASVTLDGPLVD